MDLGDLDYEGWRTILSELDYGREGSISSTGAQSTPSFSFESVGSSSSRLNVAHTSPEPFQYTDSRDAQGQWPAPSDGDALARNDGLQSFGLPDWDDTAILEELGEGVSSAEAAPLQPQYTPLTTFPGPEADAQVNLSTDPASLPVADTMVEPFLNDGFFKFGDASTPSPVSSTRQSSYASPLNLQNQQLPSIGMAYQPAGWQDFQQGHSIAFPLTPQDPSTLSPEPTPEYDNKKRKLPSDDGDGEEQKKTAKKSTHNVIEKRYRKKLSEKIDLLRDSVPALRAIVQSPQVGDADSDDPDVSTTALKLNKATILTKATEYIKQLESRNKRLSDQCNAQKVQIDTFVRLNAARRMGSSLNPIAYQTTFSDVDLGENQRMAQNQEEILLQQQQQQQQPPRTALKQASQPDYPAGRPPPHRTPQGGIRRVGGGTLSKLMVGSMAGMMILEGFGEREHSGKTPAGRGLFALPLEAIGGLRHLMAGTDGHAFASAHGNPFGPDLLLLLAKMILILGAVIYILIPSFFEPSRKNEKKIALISSTTAPPASVVSPVEVRRKIWLTATQTIRFPRHSFLEDPVAFIVTALRHCLRHLIGSHFYAGLTGTTQEQELARIKAWDVALDAQLAGGDEDISNTRLMLTLLVATTLPNTPARLMLRALHIRLLLKGRGYLLQRLSSKLATNYWNEARALHRLATGGNAPRSSVVVPSSTASIPDGLPPHLAALVEVEFQDAIPPPILQRLHNLAWNRPTSEGILGTDEGMDAVAEDFSIRTPLDALAAWWSSFALHKGLIRYLETSDEVKEECLDLVRCIGDAVRIAPPTSGAQLRALVARAALGSPKSSRESLSAALDVLPHCEIYRVQASNLVSNNAASVITMAGIRVAVRCTMSLISLQKSTPPTPKTRLVAIKLFNELSIQPRPSALPSPHPSNYGSYLNMRMGLLGFVAAWKTLNAFSADDNLVKMTRGGVEQVALRLRVWIGGERGRLCGLERRRREEIVDGCLRICKEVGCIEVNS